MTADLATMWSSLQLQLDAHRPSGASSGASDDVTSVPVCLLTGFLGSGKSTLLAALLSEPPAGLVVRAVVNDVGALPFDPTLIANVDDVRVELANGCGCCEQTSNLAATLADLVAGQPADLIVLEASGVADPLALAQIVEANPLVHLDRIVAVVDGGVIAAQLQGAVGGPIVRRQIGAAHSVIVTHADLLDGPQLDVVLDIVARSAPGCIVSPSGQPDPVVEVMMPWASRGARPSPAAAASRHDLFTVTLAQQADVGAAALESTFANSRPGLLRAKGRLSVDGQLRLVQLTPSSFQLSLAADGSCGLTLVAETEAATRLVAALLAGG